MKTVSRFVQKFTSLIACVLSCFDRVIFKGHLSLSRVKEVEKFIDYILKMRRVDFFKRCAPALAQRLVDHAQKYAARAGRPYPYRGSKFDKDKGAREILRKQPVVDGLIGVFCTKERCATFRLGRGDKRPHDCDEEDAQNTRQKYAEYFPPVALSSDIFADDSHELAALFPLNGKTQTP